MRSFRNISKIKWSFDRKYIFQFTAGGLLLLIMGVISFLSVPALIKSDEINDRLNQELKAYRKVLTILTDAETGQRGYILTGRNNFLEPYNSARLSIWKDYNELKKISSYNDSQKQSLYILKVLIARKLDIMGVGIELRRNKGLNAAIGWVATEKGKVVMDSIRQVVASMENDQQVYQQTHDAETKKITRITYIILPVGTILGFLLIVFVFFALNNEIAKRKLTEESLSESQEKYYYLYENAPVGMYHTKIDGSKILEINNTACEMLGFTKEELLGKSSAVRWADHDRRNEILKILKECGVATNFEADVLKKDGSRISCLLSMKIYKEKGFIEGFIVDITEHKQAGDKLRKTLNDLERSNKELEQFAYVASHDLQEPLRMISSYTQLLERRYQDKLDQDANDFMHYAVDGANRMQALIDDLLDYSRVTTRGKEFRSVDVNSAFAKVLMNLKAKIEKISAIITTDELPVIMADEGQLTRLLQNLIDNALKYSGQESPKIHIGCKDLQDSWQFSVRDNGIGIADEFNERIFVIFQRLHTRKDYPGTGIGLAICKRIVERHGGKIWFEPAPDKGTIFYFTILKRSKDEYDSNR